MVFDPNRFKASEHAAGTPPELRSPKGDEDIRVHPDWHFDGISIAKAKGKAFVIDQDLHSLLAGRMITCDLRAAITHDGTIFVWPVKSDNETLTDAAEKATSKWIRVKWNTNEKTHEVEQAAKQHGEPTWTFKSFDEVLDIAVKDRILTDPENETVKSIAAKKKRGK